MAIDVGGTTIERAARPEGRLARLRRSRILRRLLPVGAVPEFTDPSGGVVVAEVSTHPKWIGRRLAHMEEICGARIAYVTRRDRGQSSSRTLSPASSSYIGSAARSWTSAAAAARRGSRSRLRCRTAR